MDFIFNCPHCNQELAVDELAAGTEIRCPTCSKNLVIPTPPAPGSGNASPTASSAEAKEERHFSVPMREGPVEVLIKKAHPPLEAAAKGSDRQMRVKCIRRTDCVEVGRDRFEEEVGRFLSGIGEQDIVSITPLSYTHLDLATQKILTDYGVMIVYKG